MTSDIGGRGPRRLHLPLASRKESSTVAERGGPGVITLLTRSLSQDERAARVKFLPWRARTARDRKDRISPRGIPCCSERYRAGLSDVLSPAARRNCCLSRSSAADAIVGPDGGARVQRITLTAVRAGIPGRQGVR